MKVKTVLSNIFTDRIVTAVKFTIYNKLTTVPLTFYVSDDYWPAGELYSGSPEIFPCLSEIPQVTKTMGRFHQNQSTINVNLYSKNPINNVGETLQDLRHEFAWHNGTFQIYTYFKPSDGLATSADVNLRETLSIIGVNSQSDGQILTIQGFTSWFKDRDLSFELTSENFPQLPEKYEGKFGAIPFSDTSNDEYAIVDLLPIELSTTDGNSGTQASADYFISWQDKTNARLGDLYTVYVRNRQTEFNPAEWIDTRLPSSTQIFFTTDTINWYTTPSGTYNLQDTKRAAVDATRVLLASSIDTNNKWGAVLTHAAVAVTMNDSGAGRDDAAGTLKLTAYSAELTPASGQINDVTYEPRGSALGTAVFELSDDLWANGTSTPTILMAPFQPYITSGDDQGLAQFSDLIFELEWSNKTGDYIVSLAYDNEQDFVHYSKAVGDNSDDETAYSGVQDIRVGIETFFLHNGITYLDNTSFNYAEYFGVKTIDQYGGVISSPKQSRSLDELDLKAAVAGLKDTAGLYTSSIGSQITNPAALIKFFLCNEELGAGLPVSQVNSTTAEAELLDDQNMTFSVDRDTSIKTLVENIGVQGLVSITVTNSGSIELIHPKWQYYPDYEFHQAIMEGDLRIVDLVDLPYSSVVNKLRVNFNEDELKRAVEEQEDKYLNKIVLSKDESSEADTSRKVFASLSEDLYGPREFNQDFNFYIDRDKAVRAANYYFDRYHKLQQELTIELPRKAEYQSINLLDFVQVTHEDIPYNLNNGKLKVTEGYTTASTIEDGNYCKKVARGSFFGQVVSIQEKGEILTLTIQSVSPWRR